MKCLFKLLIKVKSFIVFFRFGRTHTYQTFGSHIFLRLMKTLNKKEYIERKKYFSDVTKDNKMKKEGFDVFDLNKILSEKSQKTLKTLRNNFFKINFNDSSDNKKKFLRTCDIKLNDDLINMIDDLTPIITNYMGCLPVVNSIEYWFSPNIENESKRSQEFHTDPGTTQVRVMIPVEEITKDHGPLTAVNAENSYEVYKKLKQEKIIKKKEEKLSDEIFYKHIPESQKKIITLNSDQIGMLDTCRCYHYGSRKSKYSRKLIAISFQSPFSVDMPIFGRELLVNKFANKKHQLLYSFFENNFPTIRKNYNLKRFQIKIL